MTTIPFDVSLDEPHLGPTCVQTYAGEERGQNTEDTLDCPLRGRSLIRPGFEQHFRFEMDPKASLPPGIFTWALGRFWNWKHTHTQRVSMRDITHAEDSPGAIFRLLSSGIEHLLTDVHGETVRQVLA